MKIKKSSAPSPRAQRILESLRRAVREELERKRRLGHYAVFWENGKPVLRGEDAPKLEDL